MMICREKFGYDVQIRHESVLIIVTVLKVCKTVNALNL
jgi:hypothetical protein